tara:strand:- start:5295 stop:6350 length:1056 start_codon:yes stop_codon:yes gene_type:complete
MEHSEQNILVVLPKFGDIGGMLQQNSAYCVDILEYDEYSLVKKNLICRAGYGLVSLLFIFFSSNQSLLKLIGRINFASKKFDRVNEYLARELNKRHSIKYSSILWIKGDGISDQILNLAQELWGVPHILYLYDPLIRYPSILSKLEKFDYVYTFDPAESFEYDLHYLPLFKRSTNNITFEKKRKLEFCIAFVGEFSWHRAVRLCHFGRQLRHDFKFVLVSKWLPNFKFLGIEFRRDRLEPSDVTNIYLRSSCLLELSNPGQSGKTQRVDDARTFGIGLVFLETDVLLEHKEPPITSSVGFIQLLEVEGIDLESVKLKVREDQRSEGYYKGVGVEDFLQTMIEKLPNNRVLG